VDFAQLNLIGQSPSFHHALTLIERFAACNHGVLIQGETGTGKELAARAIHYLGARRRFPFVPVNCGAIPEALIESELFGNVRGAFTDAREARTGIVAQASGGTLFLDEIEALALRAQVALLRFLQDKEYRPVGGASVLTSNIRVIAATNANLETMVRSGDFRADLLFRLNILKINLPTLRERPGDEWVLAKHFLHRLNLESKGSEKDLHPDSAATLAAHHWPGNVRELENLMVRHYLLEPGSMIRIRSVVEESSDSVPRAVPNPADEGFKRAKARAVAAFEKTYITGLLYRSGGNLSLASRLSGKDRSDLCKLLRKHGIQRQQYERG
jgi:DNA-binding NtrC family response regulator